MAKQLSIRDIAKMADVSVATVSRVINNNGRFSEETRQRVQKIIDETGYVTNMAARSLRSSKSGNIGLIVPDISNDFFSTLAFHAERTLQGQGYSVFVCNTGNDPKREQAYFETLTSKLVDGIICISGLRTLDADIVPAGLPVVCVDRAPDTSLDIPTVRSDEAHGTYLATSHLVERGCRRIVYITSYSADFVDEARERGYRQALAENGLEAAPELRLQVTGKRPSMYEAEDLVSALVRSAVPFDGVMASSDHAAVGALNALADAGFDVPGQVKVAGFDDSVYSRLTTPRITTVRRFPEQMAERGCRAMLSMIRGEKPESTAIVPVELVVRSSTE